jgi:hypothetical protein
MSFGNDIKIEPLSVDEQVFEIAKTKELLNNQFLQIIKNSAIDCMLNYNQNNTQNNKIACFNFSENETGKAMTLSEVSGSVTSIITDSEWLNKYKNIDVSYIQYPKQVFNKSVIIKLVNKNDYLRETIKVKNFKAIHMLNNILINNAIILYDRDILENTKSFIKIGAIIDPCDLTKNKRIILKVENFDIIKKS